jgi:hypothetical protein
MPSGADASLWSFRNIRLEQAFRESDARNGRNSNVEKDPVLAGLEQASDASKHNSLQT